MVCYYNGFMGRLNYYKKSRKTISMEKYLKSSNLKQINSLPNNDYNSCYKR